jgi:hypothetical protein
MVPNKRRDRRGDGTTTIIEMIVTVLKELHTYFLEASTFT